MKRFTTTASDGVEIKGRHWPAEGGVPKAVMALVHGFGEHCGRYAPMAAHLNAADIAVVALDLRGHGESAGSRGIVQSYDDFRADLAALLGRTRALYPDVPMILFGHSMGGGVVLDHGFNKAADIRAIIASAPLIALPKPIPAPLRFITKLMAKLRPKGGLAQPIDGEKISTLVEEQQAYMDDPLNHGTLGFGLAVGMVETGEAIAANAAAWDTPLLLLHSRDDVLTSFEASEQFAKSAQNVSFHPMVNVAHEMHNDTSRMKVYDLVTDFVLNHASQDTV